MDHHENPNCRCSLEPETVGGFACEFIGGPANENAVWLPELTPTFSVAMGPPADELTGMLKRGDTAEFQPEISKCEYTLMPFLSSGGKFVYMALENGYLED